MLVFYMIVMALHSVSYRVEPHWVVSFLNHTRREALDKVMGPNPWTSSKSVERPMKLQSCVLELSCSSDIINQFLILH